MEHSAHLPRTINDDLSSKQSSKPSKTFNIYFGVGLLVLIAFAAIFCGIVYYGIKYL